MQPTQFSHYDSDQTPMGFDNCPDQIKSIQQKKSQNSNFDILFSKYLDNGQLTDIELQQLNSFEKIIFNQVKKKTKTKRPDQYQKLFFKKAFKYAEHSFFKKNKKNRSRRMSQFYHHHFDSVAEVLKIPIYNFYHPDKKTKPGLSTGQKSFNSSYVKTVLRSASFRKVCIEYREKFREECKLERNKKISTFTGRLFAIVEKSKQDRTKLIRFLQSSKCKIPWNDKDIKEAYQRAGEDLDDYSLGEQDEKKSKGSEQKQEAKINTIVDNEDEYENSHTLKANDADFESFQFYFEEPAAHKPNYASDIELLTYDKKQHSQQFHHTSNDNQKAAYQMQILQDVPSCSQLQSSASSQLMVQTLGQMNLQ